MKIKIKKREKKDHLGGFEIIPFIHFHVGLDRTGHEFHDWTGLDTQICLTGPAGPD